MLMKDRKIWLRRLFIRSLFLLTILLLFFNMNFLLRMIHPIHYRDRIDRQAQEFQMDPMLIAAVIRVESKYQSDVVSGKGAVGLMQIMPETGQWIAERLNLIGFEAEQLKNPEINIHMGTWYLSYLRDEFGGDTIKALAAYNAGRGNVQHWLTSSRWDGTLENVEEIPFKETRNYIERVLHFYNTYKRVYNG